MGKDGRKTGHRCGLGLRLGAWQHCCINLVLSGTGLIETLHLRGLLGALTYGLLVKLLFLHVHQGRQFSLVILVFLANSQTVNIIIVTILTNLYR